MPVRVELHLNIDTLEADYQACLRILDQANERVEVIVDDSMPCDLAGLQLLVSLKKTLKARSCTLQLTGAGSQACRELWQRLGLPGGLLS